MDFGQLLHVAKKNSEQSKNAEGKYYSTKFSAPKKISKEKTLSDNIKKFLMKKEQEEREKAQLEKAKLDSLLSKRDEKSKNKIRKMLKVTKSANKSVLDDAIDNDNTSVTIQGPDQPDEDDYGYVSNEAAAFYQKYVDKVGKLPDEKFAPIRSKSKIDLNGSRERMKAAILREEDIKNLPKHSRTKTTSSINGSSKHSLSSIRKELYDSQAEKELEEKKKSEREAELKKTKIKKSLPPPMDFKELLKLAEKKQFEPIIANKVEEKKEPERLLSKKEKLELEQRKAFMEERERKKNGQKVPLKMQPNGKIPKLNSTVNEKKSIQSSLSLGQSTASFKKPENPPKNIAQISKPKTNLVKNGQSLQIESKSKTILPKSQIPSPSKTLINKAQTSSSGQSKQLMHSRNIANGKVISSAAYSAKSNYNGPTREFPPKDIKRVPSQNIKTREFPPRDLKKSRPDINRKPIKRRIYDDYDEDEYDSELDDFIEDDPEGEKNVSSYIKEIFGYDKSRFRDFDDDDAGMETNFAQQMREENISKKIGLMEDLEDMKKESEEKKRKILMKKKKFK